MLRAVLFELLKHMRINYCGCILHGLFHFNALFSFWPARRISTHRRPRRSENIHDPGIPGKRDELFL